MKIAIIGTGGVGGYFGARLAKVGYDIHFVARGAHLQALQTKGIHVKSINGNFSIERIKVSENIKEAGKADLVILGVKAWQVREVAPQLPDIMDENTVILPLQNGVSAAGDLMEFIDPENVLGGLCRIISKIEEPGVIHHFGVKPTIIFGELNNIFTERLDKIKHIFDKAGITSKIADDIHAELWKKFIAICVSGLLAVTHSTYGEIREIPETRHVMIDLLQEVYAVSKKIGIRIETDFIEKTVSYIDTFPYDSTSSLARDVWEGKASEIEYQNGTVVKLGKQYAIPVPVNGFIYSCILPMEKRARSRKS